mgnify:CR=1 FL=1
MGISNILIFCVIFYQIIKTFFEMKQFSNKILIFLKIILIIMDIIISIGIILYTIFLTIFWLLSYDNYMYLEINGYFTLLVLLSLILFYLIKIFYLFRKSKIKNTLVLISSIIELIIFCNYVNTEVNIFSIFNFYRILIDIAGTG